MNQFRPINNALKTLLSLFCRHRLVSRRENQSWIFQFRAEISTCDVRNFKPLFSQFGDIGSTKHPETCYATSLTPTEDNVLHTHWSGIMYAFVDTVKTYDVTAIGAETTRWRLHRQFIFDSFLRCQASSRRKHGDFGIVKVILQVREKLYFALVFFGSKSGSLKGRACQQNKFLFLWGCMVLAFLSSDREHGGML